jgi:hypothetical protein
MRIMALSVVVGVVSVPLVTINKINLDNADCFRSSCTFLLLNSAELHYPIVDLSGLHTLVVFRLFRLHVVCIDLALSLTGPMRYSQISTHGCKLSEHGLPKL